MKVCKWTIYTVMIPLMPLLIVTVIASQLENAIPHERILGGTEIFLFCLFIASTTYREWDNATANSAQSRERKWMSLALEVWVYGIGVLAAGVFLHAHVQELRLPPQFLANAGIVVGILTTAICLYAQVVLATAKQKREW